MTLIFRGSYYEQRYGKNCDPAVDLHGFEHGRPGETCFCGQHTVREPSPPRGYHPVLYELLDGPLTKAELAEHLGLTRERIAQILRQYRDEKLIQRVGIRYKATGRGKYLARQHPK